MSPTTRDTAELLALKARLEKLSPANRLIVAAGLIEAKKYDLAEVIARNVVDELCALRLFKKP